MMEDSMAGVEKENIAAASTPLTMDNTGSDVSSADLDLSSLPTESPGPGLSLERNVVRRRRSLLSLINRRLVRSLHEVEFEVCRPQSVSR